MEIRQIDRVADVPSIPTGTVTFLFTDIEGSTKRWERFGDAMRDAVASHDAILGAIFRDHRGYVFKTAGDAFCVAFTDVLDAVRASIAVQRRIAAGDWSAVGGLWVRIALHVGVTDERGGDYFGPAVNRVARLLAIAHGGQTVLSAAARFIAQTQLPADAALLDLGSHRLKDLSQPELVAQLNATGLRAEFPPLASLDRTQTNLPVQFAALIGRETEVGDVAALVRSQRLVSLCGAGGVGKTRIACQVGADLLGEFPDGVWFIDLAPISDPALVPRTLATIFSVSDIGSNSAVERITAALANRRALLIFDNCEHVVSAAADMVDAIRRIGSDVRFLVTTREALHLQGEHLYRVPSLAVPARTEGLRAEEALRYSAIELFVNRIASLAPFTLTDENAPIVADICKRLDGIALAIELAASRVKVLSPRQVAQRLDERFRMLTGGSRTALPRQQTLRALIDWSHDLLDARERQLFARAGVFAASFDLVAATAVCADDMIDDWDIVDLLDALVDKSLVAVEFAGDERRYRLLESMREYARERLALAADRETIRRRWMDHYRSVAHTRSSAYWSQLNEAALTALESLEIENDNFRSVLEWSISGNNDPAAGLDLASSLGQYWSICGLQAEGFVWLEAGLAVVDEAVAPARCAQGWLAVASLADNLLLGKRGLEAAQQAVRLAAACDLPALVARGSLYAGLALNRLGSYDEADPWLRDALERSRSLGEQRGTLMCLQAQARNAIARGQETVARGLYEQILVIARERGRIVGITVVTANLALLEYTCGKNERALELGREAVELCRKLNDTSLLANLLVNLAAFLIEAERLDDAHAAAYEAIGLGHERRYAIPVCVAIEHLALIAALRGHYAGPAQLLGFTQPAMDAAGFTRETAERRGFDRLSALLTEHLGNSACERLREAGSRLSEEQALDLVAALPSSDLPAHGVG